MLMRTDPFREFDRFTQRLLENGRPTVMPMDAYREGDDFVAHFDLPGVSPESIDLEVERNVLTVKAERPAPRRDGLEPIVNERPSGTFTRQVLLGDTLDTERVTAHHADGVLTLRIPVSEHSKARKIAVGHDAGREQTSIEV
ncbi:Hsp20/alpha crystallin family protein [Nocardiopsis sp. N85]|uniref:Hsp20/alpha crystallin family protein n=1 Tax=Nocardiopsis sp. N85 TaxID=3029400 RepID=UPI00237F3DB9|nr:Hsp20/alpha crystallin family protein [Nocardiopsis sp. N85]MDE3723802.1 Hsp20/alpha crystallin family protein [Nocardiopsis sp. N85]